MNRDPRFALSALEASILDDETLVNGAKAALDKLQARKRAVETRLELKRRSSPIPCSRSASRSCARPPIAEASLKAIAVAPEDIHARGWKPQPNSIRTGSPRPAPS